VATPYRLAVVTPQRRTTISPRIDYQLSKNHTLVGRYTYETSTAENSGIGTFTLPSLAYNVLDRHHNLQLTETAVVSRQGVDETRIQYTHTRTTDTGDNTVPTISVAQAFTGGGAQIGNAYSQTNHFELQNNASVSASKHTDPGGRSHSPRHTVRLFAAQFRRYVHICRRDLRSALDANKPAVLDGSGAQTRYGSRRSSSTADATVFRSKV